MWLRIKTFLDDFNRGQNYIFVPGSLPKIDSVDPHPSGEVPVSSAASPVDSDRPQPQSQP